MLSSSMKSSKGYKVFIDINELLCFIDAFNVLEHGSVSYVHTGALERIT